MRPQKHPKQAPWRSLRPSKRLAPRRRPKPLRLALPCPKPRVLPALSPTAPHHRACRSLIASNSSRP